MKLARGLADRLAQIRILAMDVDGTLTDGSIETCKGAPSLRWNVLDGLGIQRVLARGIIVVWITGRVSDAVSRRAAELGVTEVWQGESEKLARLMDVAQRHQAAAMHIAYMGDDLPDLPPMRYCGVPIAPPSAAPAVRREATYVTNSRAGHGAVREACELILSHAVSREGVKPD